MSVAAAVLLAAQAAPTQAAPPLVVPVDWSVMPPLPWRNAPALSTDLTSFVEGEVRAGRCVPRTPGTIEVEIAVFVRGDGGVRAAVPRAIDCPTVEQFAAGLITSFARNNLRANTAGWYRTAITFDWMK